MSSLPATTGSGPSAAGYQRRVRMTTRLRPASARTSSPPSTRSNVMGRVKYSEFVDLLDVESLMSDIGFEPLHVDNRGNYVGYCLWPENHTNGDTTGKFAIHPEKKVYN